MKAKNGGILFDETKKVELKKTPKPFVIPAMKTLVYNGPEKN